MPTNITEFIDALPKAEHHLHIEGSCPWNIMRSTMPETFHTPPPSWASDYRFTSFAQFEQMIFEYVSPWMTSPERYAEAAREIALERMKENVRYIEMSIAGIALELTQLPLDEVTAAIKDSLPPEIETRLFIGLHHNGFIKNHDRHLESILDCKYLDGIDLHGPEDFPLLDWSKAFWPAARGAGKQTKAHAGELSGSNAVREVISDLGVTKVQHGFRAFEDPEVVSLAVEEKVSFDVCPISNVKLGNVSSMQAHPLLQLEEAGIPCTINTDDPFVFGNCLRDDYLAVHESLGASPEILARFAKNGFTTADIDEASRSKFLGEIDAVLDSYLANQ
ncbi:adenosine deaminase family protein [Pelagicoccus albus]|uniref:Adenosine deaminase n=1 Tax=Pelagicoccus albus TaxID=415222 RepID=A0A7X1E9S2_9BACT|nr:adenosine deaminase [Pelagicoccus albus]MBC2607488.1 adenosine deaminase [Pelagicoccus albus]